MPAQVLSEETCCTCGVVFGLTVEHKLQRKQDRASFTCPNGHSQTYSKESASNLRERVEELERDLNLMRDSRDSFRIAHARLRQRYLRLKKLAPEARKRKRTTKRGKRRA